MIKNLAKIINIILISTLFISINLTADDNKLQLKELEGNWEGTGQFLVPMTNMKMDIEGSAEFKYIKEGDYLRTALTGEKFMFTYSDSGHLILNNKNDSIYWEVWDNSGKHAYYTGELEGKLISGTRWRNKDLYSVNILLKHQDSIDFKLTVKTAEGEQIDKAVFNLWRIKK